MKRLSEWNAMQGEISLVERTDKELADIRWRARVAVERAVQSCQWGYCTCCRGSVICTNPNKKS